MDNLTHGLLGASLSALRRGRGAADASDRRTRNATLLACVLAAELPDLDVLLPAGDAVLHALNAHRGISHALVTAPIWAGLATAISKAVFREQRLGPLFGFSLLSVLAAHLAADAWTGWGTRLLLPFSDHRVTWDWMVVLDPIFTVPLIAGAGVAAWGRFGWRRPLLIGLLVATGYLALRIGTRELLHRRVQQRYPIAERINVFPGWIGISRWRFVVVEGEAFVAGEVGLGQAVQEQARAPRTSATALPPEVTALPTVRAALDWARFPLASYRQAPDGSAVVRVGDLRYHLQGEPTLQFVVELSPGREVTRAWLDRGGTAAELLRRWRASPR